MRSIELSSDNGAAPGRGHSLGAHPPGMLKHRDRIADLVSVATGSGYWRDNAPPLFHRFDNGVFA
jgi:hypothetical protein